MKKVKFEDFLIKAREIHGDKYIYHEDTFKGSDSKMLISCPIHGEFWQKPYKHLKGQGCPKCYGFHKTNEEIIQEFKNVHKDKYTYEKVEYKGNHKKVCVTCPIHGDFWVTPANHLNGKGCPSCKKDKLQNLFSMGAETFIKRSNLIHDNQYDYSRIIYKNNITNVEIVCHEKDENGVEHGSFMMTPATHLYGGKCPKCTAKKLRNMFAKTKDEFINKAVMVHGNKYSYDKLNYVNNRTKVEIICPTHGSFWQNPNSHLNGRGCPYCNESHLENEIKLKLENVIPYIRIKRYKWLGKQSLDFYLPKYNVAIECQGIQHFIKRHFFDKNDPYENRIERDIRKKQLCDEHGVKLFYFSHDKFDEFLGEKVWHNAEEMIEEIKKLR